MTGQIIGVSNFRYLLVVTVEQCAELCCDIFIKIRVLQECGTDVLKTGHSLLKTMHLWSETVKSSISKEDKITPRVKTRSSL